MGVTRFGILPTPGTSCDRPEGVFRSPAYARGSTESTATARKYREHSYGKEEFCLPTTLQVPSGTSLTFTALHLIDVLNAFGLFARAR